MPECDSFCCALVQRRTAPDAAGQRREKRRRLTDRPSTMPRTIHTAIDQARANARGAFTLGDSEPTLPAMECVPAQRLYEDAGATLPSGEDRTQRRP